MNANQKITPENIQKLDKNEIFVFGSNLKGQHYGGAARIAYDKFGAIWGQGVGLQGQCYAIPTMHGGTAAIKPYVDDFVKFAKSHPELTFYVTRIGCGIAGFKDEEMAPLFKNAIGIDNVALPESFVKILTMDKGKIRTALEKYCKYGAENYLTCYARQMEESTILGIIRKGIFYSGFTEADWYNELADTFKNFPNADMPSFCDDSYHQIPAPIPDEYVKKWIEGYKKGFDVSLEKQEDWDIPRYISSNS